MGAEWRVVAGSGGDYLISDDGRLKSVARLDSLGRRVPERIMRLGISAQGYPFTTITLGGRKRTVTVHTLMLETFAGPRPPGSVACHNDGDRTNNVLSNLRWDTYKANSADMSRHGRSGEVNRAKTHCKRGHEFTPENTYVPPRLPNNRECRACRRSAVSAFHQRNLVTVGGE